MYRPKYNNKKQVVDGITFDSKKEAKRYSELKLLEKMGEISELELQFKYVLIPAQYEYIEQYSTKTGKRIKDKKKLIERECSYKADFDYIDKDGNHIVEDTKGFKTKEYIIKRKLMLYLKGIRIKEL